MANQNTNPTTYADWAKTRDPSGKTAEIVEVLSKMHPSVKDIVIKESNKTDTEETTVRAGEPRGTWVGFNEGAMPVKASSRQTADKQGRMIAYNEVDKALADLESDKAAFMLSESTATMSGMEKDHAETLFYGNSFTSPKEFMGLFPRFNDVSAENARNIINGAASGSATGGANQTSIYSITWGMQTAYEHFPKGSMVGLDMRDLGEVTVHDANGGRFQAYRVFFEHKVGFTVKDWRSCYRIAQLSVAAIKADTINLIELLIRAQHRLRNTNLGQQVIYCNEDVYTALDIAALNKTNVHLSMREWAGEEIVHFRGIPIRMEEAILSTESDVTGLTVDDGA